MHNHIAFALMLFWNGLPACAQQVSARPVVAGRTGAAATSFSAPTLGVALAPIAPEEIHAFLKDSLAGTSVAQWEPQRRRLFEALDPSRPWSLEVFKPLQQAFAQGSSYPIGSRERVVETLFNAAAMVFDEAETLETSLAQRELGNEASRKALLDAARIDELAGLYLAETNAAYVRERMSPIRKRLQAMRAERIRANMMDVQSLQLGADSTAEVRAAIAADLVAMEYSVVSRAQTVPVVFDGLPDMKTRSAIQSHLATLQSPTSQLHRNAADRLADLAGADDWHRLWIHRRVATIEAADSSGESPAIALRSYLDARAERKFLGLDSSSKEGQAGQQKTSLGARVSNRLGAFAQGAKGRIQALSAKGRAWMKDKMLIGLAACCFSLVFLAGFSGSAEFGNRPKAAVALSAERGSESRTQPLPAPARTAAIVSATPKGPENFLNNFETIFHQVTTDVAIAKNIAEAVQKGEFDLPIFLKVFKDTGYIDTAMDVAKRVKQGVLRLDVFATVFHQVTTDVAIAKSIAEAVQKGEFDLPIFLKVFKDTGYIDTAMDVAKRVKQGVLRLDVFATVFHQVTTDVAIAKSIAEAVQKGEFDLSVFLKVFKDTGYIDSAIDIAKAAKSAN